MDGNFKKPPFTLDRTHRGGLVEQLADALGRAVETGYYAAGDMLPPTRDLAEILGISRVVAIRAMRRLAEKRLIVQRPRSGSVVCAKERPLWKGQVLIVAEPGVGNADDDPIRIILRNALITAGYLPLVATVPRAVDGRLDFSMLDTMLRQQTSLVVLLDDKKDVAAWLARNGVPFAWRTRWNSHHRKCVGKIRVRYDLALDDFVRHCREKRVKSVLQVKVWQNGLDIAEPLKRIGTAVRTLHVPPAQDKWKGYGLAMWAAKVFSRMRRPLPELVFIQDDHLTTGALLAFAKNGVAIPRDVKIVSWANRDYGPVSLVPLSRMEMDCTAAGETVASSVLEYLRTGKFPENVTIGPRYVRGESF